MKGPIGYALSYPERLPHQLDYPDFTTLATLSFEAPDLTRFPCLAMAFEACRQGGTLPAVLNAANEVAVNAFLQRRIAFTDIPRIIDQTMNRHTVVYHPEIETIRAADRLARQAAEEALQRH
jgi:1-deoxy-D-xylulose-5-phosphate reductoisomerase